MSWSGGGGSGVGRGVEVSLGFSRCDVSDIRNQNMSLYSFIETFPNW